MPLLSKQPAHKPARWIILAAVVWLAATGAGLTLLWRYAQSPGPPAQAGPAWPAAVAATRSTTQPTLLVFLHPHCACSAATVGELARVMAHQQGQLNVQAFIYRPTTQPPEWSDTSLWHSAAAIPGVRVQGDDDGAVAAEFGALVSGQALLFDRHGRLLFNGGLTAARGHAGDSDGTAALAAWLSGGSGARVAPVFGCLLRGERS